jgi:transposase-like protein
MYNMSYNIKCPECGAEQKNLNLEETNGSYVCSKCDKQTTVDLEKIRKA